VVIFRVKIAAIGTENCDKIVNKIHLKHWSPFCWLCIYYVYIISLFTVHFDSLSFFTPTYALMHKLVWKNLMYILYILCIYYAHKHIKSSYIHHDLIHVWANHFLHPHENKTQKINEWKVLPPWGRPHGCPKRFLVYVTSFSTLLCILLELLLYIID
jgi:hypothetical protein